MAQHVLVPLTGEEPEGETGNQKSQRRAPK